MSASSYRLQTSPELAGAAPLAPTAGAAVTFTWRHLATLLLALAVALAMGWLPGGSGSSVGPAGGGSPTVRAARGASFLARRELSGAVVLTNSVQGLRATVNDGRLAVTGAHGLRLGLSAPAIGRGGELAPVARLGAVVLQGSSVALAAPAVSEWFTNGPHGLEQGFTIRERPAGSGPLKISQVVSGNAVGNLDARGQAVTFVSAAGVLLYDHLIVTDAVGRRVPARLSFGGGRLTITVDDMRVAYPLRVDPAIVTPVTQSPASNAATGSDPTAIAFSPNGGLVAVANTGTPDSGADVPGTVSIFTVNDSTGALTPVAQTPTVIGSTFYGEPGGVAFSPNGGLLAVTNSDSAVDNVVVFQVNDSTGALTPVTQTPATNADTGDCPFGVAFSPSGGLLATENNCDGTISVFTVNDSTGALTPVAQGTASNADTGSSPYGLAFSPNGGLLATANELSKSLSLFTVDDATGILAPVLPNPPATADGVAFSPTGGLLATSDPGNTVSLYAVNGATGVLTPVKQSPAANADTGTQPFGVAFSPNGGLLATANAGSSDVSMFTVNDSTGALTPSPQSPSSNADTGTTPQALAFSPSGALLATANSGSDTVSVFKVQTTAGTTGTGAGSARIAAVTVKSPKVSVVVGCSGSAGEDCAGALALTTVEHLKGHKLTEITATKTHGKSKQTTVTVSCGGASYSLAGGAQKTLTIKLSGSCKRLLAERHKLPAKLSLTPSGSRSATATKTITIR